MLNNTKDILTLKDLQELLHIGKNTARFLYIKMPCTYVRLRRTPCISANYTITMQLWYNKMLNGFP